MSTKPAADPSTVGHVRGSSVVAAVEQPQRWRDPWPAWWTLSYAAPHSDAKSQQCGGPWRGWWTPIERSGSSPRPSVHREEPVNLHRLVLELIDRAPQDDGVLWMIGDWEMAEYEMRDGGPAQLELDAADRPRLRHVKRLVVDDLYGGAPPPEVNRDGWR